MATSTRRSYNPPRELDVHMAGKGANFPCSQCHLSKQHVVSGSRYDINAKDTEGTGKPGLRRDVATCESCHGTAPHPKAELVGFKLNGHVAKVACQTCHIPALARGGVATIVDWDWREAGKTKNGVGFSEETYVQGNGEHRHTYRSIKGSFTYGETWPAKGRELLPAYAWFDGQMRYTTIDTQFDPAKAPIAINSFQGSYSDPKSRIWPFKRDAHGPALRQGQQHPRLHAPMGRGQGRLLGQLRLRPGHRGWHGAERQAL